MDTEFIRQTALSLPEVTEQEHWGKRSFRVRDRIFAVIRPDGLLIKVSVEQLTVLTTLEPETFRRPPDFATSAFLLVDTDRLGPKAIKAVLVQAWRLVAPKRAIALNEAEQP